MIIVALHIKKEEKWKKKSVHVVVMIHVIVTKIVLVDVMMMRNVHVMKSRGKIYFLFAFFAFLWYYIYPMEGIMLDLENLDNESLGELLSALEGMKKEIGGEEDE